MGSKYDAYWQGRLQDLKSLLGEAYGAGRSRDLDVADIQEWGQRSTWYGVVEVSGSGIRRGEMAHARALAWTIMRRGLLAPYERAAFRLTISGRHMLTVERLQAFDEVAERPGHGAADLPDAGEPAEDVTPQEGQEAAQPSPQIGRSGTTTLLLFPCSGSKADDAVRRTFARGEERRTEDCLTRTRERLLDGRQGMAWSVRADTPLLPAIDRYTGLLYQVPGFRESVRRACIGGTHVLILSGAYGVVLPNEPIHWYERPFNVAYWYRNGLHEIIEEYIESNRVTHVYGFFSATTQYSRIMPRVNWRSVRGSRALATARTHLVGAAPGEGAQRTVPARTGRLIRSFIRSSFDEAAVTRAAVDGSYVRVIDHLARGRGETAWA